MTAEAGLGESFSRDPATDLLRRFGVVRCRDAELMHGVSGGEVELGLSLGGYFWADPEKIHPVRASSISDLSIHDDEGILQPIARACSLPMESEEEHRKRKGFQSLKRMEVKRQRMERWESRIMAKHDTNHTAVDGLSRLRSTSQQSVGSQGSSGLLDFYCGLGHGLSSCKEVKNPPSSIPLVLIQAGPIRSVEEDKQSKKKLEIEYKAKELERRGMEEMPCKQSKERLGIADKAKELERSRMEEMPCVSARGNGPNGRMIQGLLYKYGNGMDVRIVCVCHGSFLTPTEFVKHAGGGDVAHPLRHIIVSRPPFAF